MKYLTNGGESNIFNLGSSQDFSVKEIVEAARKATNLPIPEKVGERRSGNPSKLVASSDKARKILGWKPSRTNINTIIEDAWIWHKTHKNGYGK